MNSNVAQSQDQKVTCHLEASVDATRRFGIFPRTRPICRAVRAKASKLFKDFDVQCSRFDITVGRSPDRRFHPRVSIQAELNCTQAQMTQLKDFLVIDLEHAHTRTYGAKAEIKRL